MEKCIIEFGFIYIIRNKLNGKYYLGSTKDLHKRKIQHFNKLKRNKHHCIHLQRAFNIDGIENFEYICIETSFTYTKREQELLNLIDFKDAYNVSKSASGGDLIFNHPNRALLVQKATERLRNAKRVSLYKEENSNWRGGKTFCKCGSRINSGTLNCAKCRNRTGENNPFFNKKHSDVTKDKIRKKATGRTNGIQSKKIIIDNIEYPSLSEASRILNLHITTICHRLNSPNKKFINYNYK